MTVTGNPIKFMTLSDTEIIASKEDLANFLTKMLADYSSHGEEWENQDIPSFLEAFQAWLLASDNFYKNQHVNHNEVNPWRRMGDALAAARIYE